MLVAEREAPADDRIEEALGLAGACAGRNDRGPAPEDGADGLLLMAVQARVLDEVVEEGVKQPVFDEVGGPGAFAEAARQAM